MSIQRAVVMVFVLLGGCKGNESSTREKELEVQLAQAKAAQAQAEAEKAKAMATAAPPAPQNAPAETGSATAPTPTAPAPEARHRDDRDAVATSLNGSEEMQKIGAELGALQKKLDAAIQAVANAKDADELKAAQEQLALLNRQKRELNARIAALGEAAETGRRGGAHIRQECLDNPLAKGCE
jgi:hypothetical protein